MNHLDSAFHEALAFGPNTRWLAVRSRCAERVAQALGLAHIKPCHWAQGLSAAGPFGEHVFVTDAVQGWVLVTGALPYPGGSAHTDDLKPLLQRLGMQFQAVQYFGSGERFVWQAWAKYEQGQLSRAYAFVDNDDCPIWDHGTPCAEELAVRRGSARSQTVRELAGHWSVDPSRLLGSGAASAQHGLLAAWP